MTKEQRFNIRWDFVGKAIGSIAVCMLGFYSMKLTNGRTGIGWAILGLTLIWVK